MTHEEKVLLWVMAQPDSGYHVTAQGKRDYDALIASGFQPSAEDVAAATVYLKGEQP